MRQLAWLLKWILKAAIFFVLFAFALNNPHAVTVHWFFGHATVAPLVLVVLASFVLGVVVGILGMAPRWWRQRRAAKLALARAQGSPANPAAAPAAQPDATAALAQAIAERRPIDGA